MSSSDDRLDILQRSAPVARPPARRGARLTVLVLVLGVLAVAWVALKPILFPPRQVEVAQVEAGEAASSTAGRAGVVEAQGWIEAAPWPISVRPLVPGIVDTMEVVEGDEVVAQKTVIATLRNLDLENEAVLAAAALDAMRAAEGEARARLEVARSLREQLLVERSRLTELAGRVEEADASVRAAEEMVRVAQASLAAARVDVDAQQRLLDGGSGLPVALARAEAKLHEAEARVRDAQAGLLRARAAHKTLQGVHELAREGVDDPRDAEGEVTRAGAALAAAEARTKEAEARQQVAASNVAHLEVRAPADGRVLRLEAAPGALVGPQGDFKEMGEPSASGTLNRMSGTLCVLYVPHQLQARIDVPTASVGGIVPGTEVEISVEGITKRAIAGTVSRLVREADLNKNTLQVKVALEAPPESVVPEMLCRARFDVKATASTAPEAAQEPTVATWWVPADAVVDGAVFVHDPAARTARRVSVEPLETRDGRTRVAGPLGHSSKVIRRPQGLDDGTRVEASS
ncbi:MAG: HlyD family secretion protein [Planctomycetota bacterium]